MPQPTWVLLLTMSIPLWLQCTHLLMATSSKIMHHVTKLKSSQTGLLNMTMSSLYSNGLHSRGLHGGPETRGPGTRPGTCMGSSLYFKWSTRSGLGPNLLLQVLGLFNFVCNTGVDRRTPHPPEISVSHHAFVKLGWEKYEREIRWKKKKSNALPQPLETELI